MPRDSQRQKLYDAEAYTRARYDQSIGSGLDPYERAKLCETFVNNILMRKYVQRKYPKAAKQGEVLVEVSVGAYRFARAIGGHTITLPSAGNWAYTKLVMIHELAHIIEHRENGAKYGWHDWPFAAIFLDLTRNVMGKHVADDLKREFKHHRVRFRPKRKRQLTPEQRQAARERMVKARAVREEKLAFKRKVIASFKWNDTFMPRESTTVGKVLGCLPVDKHPKYMDASEFEQLKRRMERYEKDRVREAQRVAMTPEEQRREDFRYRMLSEFAVFRPHSFVTITGII